MIAINQEREEVIRRPSSDRMGRPTTCESNNKETSNQPSSKSSAVLLGLLLAVCAIAIASIVLVVRWNTFFGSKTELMLVGVVENQETRLGSKIGGRIAEVFVSEGDVVEPGRILLRIDVPELTSQRVQLEAVKATAEAKLELAKNGPLPEQIEAAKANLESAELLLAELKAGYRSEEIAQATVDVDVRHAEEIRARNELDRMKQLQRSNSISRSEVDTATAIWESASGQVAMAKQRLKLLQAGPRPETISGAQAKVRRAQAELHLLLRGTRDEELKQLESQLQEINGKIYELDVHLAESRVVAPSKCIVEVIPVRKGDIAQPNQPVVRVRAQDDLWIKAYVPETELGKIRLNQQVEITHDGDGRPYLGTVVHIASASEFTPRNVQSSSERQHQVFGIKIRPNDSTGVFKSGMAAQVRLPLVSTGK